uniref:Endo/exonuclease/phosphatase domain-containing protein n=1 Tax=Schistocephalus solidus TaxID=70667 RepID=A0A183TFX7_SCHSO
LWLLVAVLFPAATPRATVTTSGLNQARVSGAVCASTPGIADSRTSHLPPLKKSYGGGDSNPTILGATGLDRMTALVVRELAHYKVDIATLSETRLSEQGHQLEEVGAGYTFFWSGRPKAKRRDADVAFAVRNDIVGRPPCLSQSINDRLMSLRLPLQGDKLATIISAYDSPTTSSDASKDKFNEDLRALLVTAPKVDRLIVLGEFNARVGTNHAAWQGVLGPHGLGWPATSTDAPRCSQRRVELVSISLFSLLFPSLSAGYQGTSRALQGLRCQESSAGMQTSVVPLGGSARSEDKGAEKLAWCQSRPLSNVRLPFLGFVCPILLRTRQTQGTSQL